MHGRPRITANSVDDSRDEGKARKVKLLLEEVLRNHQERRYTQEALKQNARLLEINPEVYTAWNYRKIALQHLMDSEPDEAAHKLMAEDELRLVERALRVNVKSYGAWYHRKWIIDFKLSSLDHEFLLLKRLLKDDSRNFHGWDYRRFAVRAKKLTVGKELEYATEKINENFSNYSAWHYRSTLLSQLVKGHVSKEDILKDEYELVNQAYFTEPDDQSAWFYNTWLLGEMNIDSAAHSFGTWPLDGSTVCADADKQSLLVLVSSRNTLDVEFSFYSKAIPVIISFNEAVANVTIDITSKPELVHLNNISWRSLCIQGPSKVWLAEIPIQGCQETEYTVSLQISSPSMVSEKLYFTFNLQVGFGHFSAKDLDSGSTRKTCNGSLIWPGKNALGDEKEERKLKLENEWTDLSEVKEGKDVTDPDTKLCCGEFRKKVDNTEVGEVVWQERILNEQIRHLKELLDLERNSKWAKLTLTRVLLAHGAQTCNYGHYTEPAMGILKELMEIDPIHMDFYESLLSTVFIAKVVLRPGLESKVVQGNHDGFCILSDDQKDARSHDSVAHLVL